MKSLIIMAVLLSTAASLLLGQGFYDINTINTIEITFEQADWDEILDSLKQAGDEGRLTGSVTINGEQYDSVGVRYKGNSSYNPENGKNPLNIKLDYIIDNQDHQGYGTLRLANVYKDPSFVRETLSYEIARSYMPAGEANYANVYVNGALIGLYTNVQDVDKLFMRSHFYSDENPRFKGDAEQIFGPNVSIWKYFGSDSSLYFDYYELESDYGWNELIDFLDTLNNYSADVSNVLNVDRHLWMLAFDLLMVNLDAPVNVPHNFYLYQDNTGRFNPIIWDLNENFGVFTMIPGSPPGTDITTLSPFLNSTNDNYPIISKILQNSTYRKQYIAHMKTIIKDYFSNGRYLTRAQEIQSIIDAAVQADPNKFYTYNDFTANLTTQVGGGPMGIIGISQLMEARLTYLESRTEFQASAPLVGNVQQSPNTVMQNTTVWITAGVSDADNVQLAYRRGMDEVFTKVQMYDDGNHNDGSSGDGVFGASITAETEDIDYYIYAENSSAAAFSPERAEYEFYSIDVIGNLVINEFMALNESAAADQDGEYDDWIELYNNGSSDISLNGYYLTDNLDNLTKWNFPDTTIAAGGYLIIWADEDGSQQGLHANFKLSGSGEALLLVDPDTNIVDEITFGAQLTDTSYGRYPNGTGEFVYMLPSFATANTGEVTTADNDEQQMPGDFQLMQNYPNPFNPSTTISFTIPESADVSLIVYNSLGESVAVLAEEYYKAGTHAISFNAADLASGIYFYRMQSGDFVETKKMLLLK